MTHRIAELTAPEVDRRLAAGACAILPMGSLDRLSLQRRLDAIGGAAPEAGQLRRDQLS